MTGFTPPPRQHQQEYASPPDGLSDRQLMYGIFKEIRALRMLIIALVLIQVAVGLWVAVDMLRAADGVV